MKRLLKSVFVLCLLLAFVCTGCGQLPNEQPPVTGEVSVEATVNSVTIKDTQVATYDYTSLFTITVDGVASEVQSSYIDASKVSEAPGIYVVTCTYGGKSASIAVQVLETIYELTLSQEEVSVKASSALEFDYKALFSAKIDGEAAEITDDMVTTDLKAEKGDYTYTVTLHGQSASLTVHVLPDHVLELLPAYSEYKVPVSAVDSFDYTALFSLYVDSVAVQVTASMIDTSAKKAEVGASFTVTATYTSGSETASAGVTIHVIAESEVVITSRNVTTYPNSAVIDLTTLFTITYGSETVPVTIDMITGSIDYSVEGDNEIVCSYGGKQATAVVKVKLGVVLGYAVSDTVTVRKGTDIRSYPFASDFTVVINGARYLRIPDSCFDLEGVNFDEEGSYPVTLTIQYSDAPKGGSSLRPTFPPLTEESLTITYVVVADTYDLSVKAEKVTLNAGTSSYDPFTNLTLKVNGVNKSFTNRADYADAITVYAVVEKGVDFTQKGEQTVTVAVYVSGTDKEPVRISFVVELLTSYTLTGTDKIAFVGSSMYARDLFTLKNGDETIPVTDDMIVGKIDLFHVGIYHVTANYEGLTASATVCVYSRELIGTYFTYLTTMPEETEDDDDEGAEGWGGGYDDYGDYDIDAYSIATAAYTPAEGTKYLGNLVIGEDGSIVFDGKKCPVVTGVDENTLIVQAGENSPNQYTLHYYDGIVVLDPENPLQITFSDYLRPILYFKEGDFEVKDVFTVNYGKYHVLQKDFLTYSLDTFEVEHDGETFWYGLYIQLVSRWNSDSVYQVEWGEAEYSDFARTPDAQGVVTFGGKTFEFTVLSEFVGKTNRGDNVQTSPYRGKRFTGTVDGQSATLAVDGSSIYTLTVNGKQVFRLSSSYEIANLKNGGVLPGDVLFVYTMDYTELSNTQIPPYSYQFKLDVEAGTFTILPRDPYFGRYENGTTHLYLDGYGSGMLIAEGEESKTITYEARNGEIDISIANSNPKYPFGTEAQFYIAPLLNVLTVKSSYNDVWKGLTFVNAFITDGAIVTVTTSIITSSDGANGILNGVKIVTKDGELTTDEKKKVINTDAVNVSVAGFYRFSVTISVCGEDVVSHYTVQVLTKDDSLTPILGTYGAGVIDQNTRLSVDEYGRAFVARGSVTYSGTYSVYTDGDAVSFVLKAYSESGEFLSGVGTKLADGLVLVKFDGAFKTSDYFSTGSHRVSGTSGTVLHEFTVGSTKTYILADTDRTIGELVSAEALANNVYKLTKSDGSVIFVKVTAWGNVTSGLAVVGDPQA